MAPACQTAEQQASCRPREGGDPYAVSFQLNDGVATPVGKHKRRWLWVPAFAGTTHMMRSAIPAPPLKQRGGKIRRIALHLHQRRRRVRERDRLDHLAIEMPGGMAE